MEQTPGHLGDASKLGPPPWTTTPTFLFLATLPVASGLLFSGSCLFPADSGFSSGFLGWPPFPSGRGTLARRSRAIFTTRLWGAGVSLSGVSTLVSLRGRGSVSLRPSSWITTACRQPLVLPLPWAWACGTGPSGTESGLGAPTPSLAGNGAQLPGCSLSPGAGVAGPGSLLPPARGRPFVFTLGLSLQVGSLRLQGTGPGSLSPCELALVSAAAAKAEALAGLLGCLVPTVCLGGGSCCAGDLWLPLLLAWGVWGASAGPRGALLQLFGGGASGSAGAWPVAPPSPPPLLP